MNLEEILAATAIYLKQQPLDKVKAHKEGEQDHMEITTLVQTSTTIVCKTANSGTRIPSVTHEMQVSILRNSDKDVWADWRQNDQRMDMSKVDNVVPKLSTLRPLAEAPEGAQFVEKVYYDCNGPVESAWKIHQSNNIFVRSAMMAFAEHLPLRWKPDYILQCMVLAFNIWLNDFDGASKVSYERQELRVKLAYPEDWDASIERLSGQLAEIIPEALRPILVHQFSTTTPEMAMSHTLTVAAAFRKFVDIRFDTLCGISSITLEGTRQDWRSLKLIANAMLAVSQGELQPWISMLNEMIDLFLESYDGQLTENSSALWDNLINFKGDSGSHSCDGWLNVLFPFICKRTYEYYGGASSLTMVQNPLVWKRTWQTINMPQASSIVNPENPTGCRIRNPDYYSTDFACFPNTIIRQVYPWTDLALKEQKIMISAGLVAVLQWPDGALEPFQSWQLDLYV